MAWDLFFSALLIGGGIFLLLLIEKLKNEDKYMYLALIIGIILVVFGGWMLTKAVSAAVLKRKFWGFLVAAFGSWMVFGFPSTSEYQTDQFGYTGILIGLVALIGGIYLLVF